MYLYLLYASDLSSHAVRRRSLFFRNKCHSPCSDWLVQVQVALQDIVKIPKQYKRLAALSTVLLASPVQAPKRTLRSQTTAPGSYVCRTACSTAVYFEAQRRTRVRFPGRHHPIDVNVCLLRTHNVLMIIVL